MRQDRQAALAHAFGLNEALGVALHRALGAASGGDELWRLALWLGRGGLGPEGCEDAALGLGLRRGRLRGPEVPPLAERLRVVAGHVLGPLARQGSGEFFAVPEVVTAIVELDTAPMARQGDIGGVAVQARRGQHMRAVHRHALSLVDGGGVAVIHMGVGLQIELGRAPAVQAHPERGWAHALDLTQRAVLHAEVAVVLQEHDPVAGRELALAALGLRGDVLAQRSGLAQPLPGGQVQRLHLVSGVGQDDAGLAGLASRSRSHPSTSAWRACSRVSAACTAPCSR